MSESLTFEVSQSAILGLGPPSSALSIRSARLLRLLSRPFADLDVDFAGLRDRSFRFVKVDAEAFLRDMEERGAGLSPAPI